mmetsp:Transcript_7874/g.15202  ORF Transcript_7874/g.15202 Transcript_7874/m.15202 type:complete len:84 (+) Transcript_7874:766-1017(+)
MVQHQRSAASLNNNEGLHADHVMCGSGAKFYIPQIALCHILLIVVMSFNSLTSESVNSSIDSIDAMLREMPPIARVALKSSMC